jgi:hypothetical protein
MLHIIAAPAHRDLHPHWKIHAQKLMKNVQVIANEAANEDNLAAGDTRAP